MSKHQIVHIEYVKFFINISFTSINLKKQANYESIILLVKKLQVQ